MLSILHQLLNITIIMDLLIFVMNTVCQFIEFTVYSHYIEIF